MKTGAVEGAVGGAVASAFTLPDLASKGEDVGFSDLLLTTAMGGILGSVFGAMGGGIAGYRGTRAAREVQAANDRFLASEAATQTESLRTTLARDIFDARLAANPDLDQAQLRSEAAVAAILFDRRAHSWASGEEGRAAQDYYATWLPAFRGAEDLETAIRNEWTAGRGIDNDFLSNFRPLEPEREQPPVVETPAAGKRRARRKQTSAPIETEVQPTNFRQNQGEVFQETARSGIQGREDSLATSAGSQPFRYEVRELDELVPSHDPLAQFQRRNDYPRDVQERPYHSDAGEQDKVRNNAANLDPRYLINDNPDAMTGPPIVTPGGIVLGGNSRTMSMQLASAKHAERFAAYKQALQDKAAQFGVDPAQIQGMRKPVLVRVVDGGKTTLDLANAARRYNEVTTQALQPEAEGVSKAKLVTPNTVAYLNTKLTEGDFGTLREFLDHTSSKEFVGRLLADGVIEQRQASRVIDAEGLLTPEGKGLVEGALRGIIIPNYDLIRATPKSIIAKLDRAIPSLVQLKGVGDRWDISKTINDALYLINQAQKQHADAKTVKDAVWLYLNQGQLIEKPEFTQSAKALAVMLTSANPKEISMRMAGMAQDAANFTQRGGASGLLGDMAPNVPDAAESFIANFIRPVITRDGVPLARFSPTKNPEHEIIQYILNNGGMRKR